MLANYSDQLNCFRALLEPKCQRPILFFRGESGSGKTTLLHACLNEVKSPVKAVTFNFKAAGGNSIAEIFYRVTGDVGWERMKSFHEIIRGSSVSLSEPRIVGYRNQINIALQTAGPGDKEERYAELTEVWTADLQNLNHPLLLVMDTFEKADTAVKQWVTGPLLARVTRLPSLRILLAGQEVPDRDSIEWGRFCHSCELFGVPDAEHWLPVVEGMGKEIPVRDPLSWLAGVCHAYKGRPLDIMQTIEALPARQSHHDHST